MENPAPAEEAADELAMAVIATSLAPLLLLDGNQNVVTASLSFCQDFAIAPASLIGATLASLGNGEWNIPQLGSLLHAVGTGRATVESYEVELVRPGSATRRLVVNARKLANGEADKIRLMLSVSDVTDARLADKLREELLRDKELLLQELQHRVANSLQIIASVLMQSARRVQSDETRTHLYDAHNRVMSVASLQKQLSISRVGDVELRSYFSDLCLSIGASMIRDQNELLLKANVDDSVATANVSVSLGLIVTELVINALKHAFPGQRAGHITVDYQSSGPAWTLSVTDDGVGMPAAGSSQPGLGTSVVQAISKQLDATVEVSNTSPGTRVAVNHDKEQVDRDTS